jgi:hypothetical protein
MAKKEIKGPQNYLNERDSMIYSSRFDSELLLVMTSKSSEWVKSRRNYWLGFFHFLQAAESNKGEYCQRLLHQRRKAISDSKEIIAAATYSII